MEHWVLLVPEQVAQELLQHWLVLSVRSEAQEVQFVAEFSHVAQELLHGEQVPLERK